ncbi:MAG TPA: hypothetical protein VGC61_01970 [Pyrinomonadaceae bacterium]|jgi:hypothetical protein
MNSTGRHSEKSGYLVTLLLMVGLTAFSHSMKELTEIHQLTLDASRLVAQWSGNVTPAEIPQTIVKIKKLESCESKQSAPSVELPWLTETSAVAPGNTRPTKTVRIARPVITIPSEAEIAKLKKLHRVDIDSDEFEVRIPSVQLPEAGEPVSTDIQEFTFKAKARKPGTIKINPRDREMLLKTLNRSINLRIAS